MCRKGGNGEEVLNNFYTGLEIGSESTYTEKSRDISARALINLS